MWIQLPDVCEAHALCSRPFIGINESYTERQLWELYIKFGTSPRSLALHASDPVTHEGIVARQIMQIGSDDLRSASRSPESHFHHIFVMFPSPDHRDTCEKRIISQHVFELLREKHLQHNIPGMEYFYNQF